MNKYFHGFSHFYYRSWNLPLFFLQLDILMTYFNFHLQACHCIIFFVLRFPYIFSSNISLRRLLPPLLFFLIYLFVFLFLPPPPVFLPIWPLLFLAPSTFRLFLRSPSWLHLLFFAAYDKAHFSYFHEFLNSKLIFSPPL